MPTTITFFPVDNGDMTLIKFGDLDATTLLIDINIRQDADDPGRGRARRRQGPARTAEEG
jgi:hypothetical protein